VHIPYRFQSSALVSQRHHAGRAFHNKAVTKPSCELEMLSNVETMRDERKMDKNTCEEIESLFGELRLLRDGKLAY
jgi:hypothetical protein